MKIVPDEIGVLVGGPSVGPERSASVGVLRGWIEIISEEGGVGAGVLVLWLWEHFEVAAGSLLRCGFGKERDIPSLGIAHEAQTHR